MNGQVQKNIASFGSFQSLEHGIVPWPASGALLLGEGEGLTGERGGTGEEFKTAQHDGEDNARPWTAMSSGLVSRGEMLGMARLHLGEEGTSSDG
jgi:hypothetical protein